MVKNSHRKWTADADEALKDKVADGRDLTRIAAEFGRSELAIMSRIMKLKIYMPITAVPELLS